MVGPPRDVMGDGAQVSFPGSSRDQVSGWDPHSEMVCQFRARVRGGDMGLGVWAPLMDDGGWK